MGKDSRISEMELQLATAVSAHEAKKPECKKNLEALKARADDAAKKSGKLKEKLSELDEEKIISKFKASEANDQAIADAEAPEVLR